MQIEKISVGYRWMIECPACSLKVYESLAYSRAINGFYVFASFAIALVLYYPNLTLKVS